MWFIEPYIPPSFKIFLHALPLTSCSLIPPLGLAFLPSQWGTHNQDKGAIKGLVCVWLVVQSAMWKA